MLNKKYGKRVITINLYNPKEEGVGKYDVHYINAYNRIKGKDRKDELNQNQRYAA